MLVLRRNLKRRRRSEGDVTAVCNFFEGESSVRAILRLGTTLLLTYFCRKLSEMTASLSAQDQIAALLADSIPDKILAFKFAPSIQQRIEVLVNKKKGNISLEEKDELDRYIAYDLLIGLAKARASNRPKAS